MHALGWLDAGAVRGEPFAAQRPQKAFGHLAAA
jgi:hypothetical protein